MRGPSGVGRRQPGGLLVLWKTPCPEHGLRVVRPPWAEASSRFTALFEALAISWLKLSSQQGVAELLALTPMKGTREPFSARCFSWAV